MSESSEETNTYLIVVLNETTRKAVRKLTRYSKHQWNIEIAQVNNASSITLSAPTQQTYPYYSTGIWPTSIELTNSLEEERRLLFEQTHPRTTRTQEKINTILSHENIPCMK